MIGPNRRTVLRGGVGVASLVSGALAAPALLAQTKSPYAGTTINASCFQTTFFEYLKNYFPQFEEKTGIKVAFTMQAFPVYNQRTDLELSTKGSALDVVNATFIYTGRWIGAGWLTNLDTFTKDPKMTPADWQPEDFVAGTQSAMQNAKGETFAFSWEGGAMIQSAARYDLIEKAGLAMPKTFDELIKVCDATHGKDGVAAFTADKLHHWNWIPYLMGMGGGVFKAPPENLTPTLNTPQAAQSGEWYANLLMKYGPDGLLS
ncbi:MAG: multiple sugar transport system substrate-binding protein, partial [Rhodospirillaceae bacterium]|nr:multiple sugar transport system substrate-binding protein [Rhodospirillaceae bacterium]